MKRFIIKDKETKKIKRMNYKLLDFASYTSARDFLTSMKFGLGFYYEIFDDQEQEIVFDGENIKRNGL